MSSDLSRFKYLIFDVYGTLVDWETGIYTALEPLLAQSDSAKRWSRADALAAYMAVESDVQAQHPDLLYTDVLARVYDELARRLAGFPSAPEPSGSTVAPVTSTGGAGGTAVAGTSASASTSASTSAGTSAAAGSGARHSEAGAAFGAAIGAWQPFPDSAPALGALAALGLKLVVLSNVDKASFTRTRALLEQGFAFDHVFTAEEIGSYKPDPANFRFALAQLGSAYPSFDPADVIVVAQSLLHDHVPAHALGLSSAWIARPDALTCMSGAGVPADEAARDAFATFKFGGMREFAEAMQQARK